MSKILRLPALIDIHVHFRDPGQVHKEDFYTGSHAALSGGVCTVFDMPNNTPGIFTLESFRKKVEKVKQKTVCDFGLYFGTNGENFSEFERVAGRSIGLKVYLNETTGNYQIKSWKKVEKIFEYWPKEKMMVFHAEEKMIDLIIDLSSKHNRPVHITHVSRKKDLKKIINAKNHGINLTCDVTPHHLFLSEKDSKKLKGYGKVKPPLATEEDREYLFANLANIDCIGSDHAPHTKQEKTSINPFYGMPGVEMILPLLITEVNKKNLKLEDLIRLTNTNPQKIFGYRQDEDTYIEIDMDAEYTIKNKDIISKCGWTPYNNFQIKGKLKRVYLRGQLVLQDGQLLAQKGTGVNILD